MRLPPIILITFCLIHCTSCHSDKTMAEKLSEFETESSFTFKDCGSETTEQCTKNANMTAQQCFKEAFDTCDPAKFVSTIPTVEGDPIYRYFYVIPDTPCRVFEFVDNTEDNFAGEKGHFKHVCMKIELADTSTCKSFVASDCAVEAKF